MRIDRLKCRTTEGRNGKMRKEKLKVVGRWKGGSGLKYTE